MIKDETYASLFYSSAVSKGQAVHATEEVIDWIREQNERVRVEVKQTSFDKLNLWSFKGTPLHLGHDSGKFFTIEGVRVKTNKKGISTWDQPIIDQPEIGYLGFIVKEIKGVLHFLVQAKIEPGNVNYVQLSPTLQATNSNYTEVHKGKRPDYLEYFTGVKPENVLLDQLQSEQGARFLKKRNRNIIIRTEVDIHIKENFIWVTLAQIKELMQMDNLVNMDTRTVISGISYQNIHRVELSGKISNENIFSQSLFDTSSAVNDFDHIIRFITDRKCRFELEVEKIGLDKMEQWVLNDNSIHHIDEKYFRVIAVDVEIENREVATWTQPMIQPAQKGICAFVCKEINGVLHFAVQAKLECGNFDVIEFAPTVQALTGNYRLTGIDNLPFLKYVLNAPKEKVIFDTLQSEEGGRFYREQNRNLMVMADDSIGEELPENFIWMTLQQLLMFIRFNNYINIQARSLLAAISFTSHGEN